MNISQSFKKGGFTLIEVVITLGLIAILAAIVIVAINPGRQFAQARNTQRTSDVNSILNAIYQYAADNNGNLPPSITAGLTEGGGAKGLCKTGAGSCNAADVNVSPELVTTYLVSLPVDPETPTASTSVGYSIQRLTGGRMQINAFQTDIPPATVVITIAR